jgi:four helix bundle protein
LRICGFADFADFPTSELEDFATSQTGSLNSGRIGAGMPRAPPVGMNPKAAELRIRLRRFAVRTGKFLRTLPRDPVTLEIVRQLAKSSGGTSANYHASCRGRSRAEFIAKLGVALEEADESEHWLKVLIESDIGTDSELDDLHTESCELRAILKASYDTASANYRRHAQEQPSASARRPRRTPYAKS